MSVFDSITTAPLEYVFADALLVRGETASVYSCPMCASILVAYHDEGSLCRECGAERIHSFAVEEGSISHWPGRHEFTDRLEALLAVDQRLDFAVLYGSRARGDEQPLSDFDLAIGWRGRRTEHHSTALLAHELSSKLGFQVEVGEIWDLRRDLQLFDHILKVGRPLLDRRGRWPEFQAQAPQVALAAERARAELRKLARKAHRSVKPADRPAKTEAEEA